MTDYPAAPVGASKTKGFKCGRQSAEKGDVIGFRRKIRARSLAGGETGQPDRCVYASVSQERRNLPELGRATSGLPGSFILCVATILERNRKEK